MKNYSLISLLNSDYKIFSKALASRIKPLMTSLISHIQTGFIKNRFIGENVRFTLDLIDFCNKNKLSGLLLLVDFEKAFDRLEWDFIFKCLRFFNFHDGFIRWIKTLYSNTSACVCKNGYSSPFFSNFERRPTGLPCKSLYFIICAEVLALKINSSRIIRGISILDHETRILQYADDLSRWVT